MVKPTKTRKEYIQASFRGISALGLICLPNLVKRHIMESAVFDRAVKIFLLFLTSTLICVPTIGATSVEDTPRKQKILEILRSKYPEASNDTSSPGGQEETEVTEETDFPTPIITYVPKLPPIGDYSLEACRVPSDEQIVVKLRDNESLMNAAERLRELSSNLGGVIEVHWDTVTRQCDYLRIPSKKAFHGPFTLRGVHGPNGELPRFYCRSETRDGTVPLKDVRGEFLAFPGKHKHEIVVESIHGDGYKRLLVTPIIGRLVYRGNYFHHALGDAISNSNNATGGGQLDVEGCGNEIAHSGQGNGQHNHYIHRSLGGAGATELDGSDAWTQFTFVDNLCHSSPFSSCVKSIANGNTIVNNRIVGSLETDPTFTVHHSSLLIDIPACSLNLIEGNYLEGVKPASNRFGDMIVGIRNRKTKVRGCDIPTMYSPEVSGRSPTSDGKKINLPPEPIPGPWHSNTWWKALEKSIQFPTQIKNNVFVASGEFGHKYFAITMFGTYPNYDLSFNDWTCHLPAPESWYERSRVYADYNRYQGFKPNRLYRSKPPAHNFHNRCPTNRVPGPGPSVDMIESGSSESVIETN